MINPKIKGSDIEVSKDDQQAINNFSKLYSKTKDNEEILRQLNEKINQQDDTMDEMDLNDDSDQVRYRFGNCFFTLTTEQARGFVEKERDALKDKHKVLKTQVDEATKKMKKLRATLYSKFGNSINLEE